MKSHLTLLPILISLSALFLVSCPDPAETPETPGFTVYYHANGAEGGTVPAAQTKEPGVPLLLADNSGNLYRNGYYFDGWNTRADGEGAYYGGEVSYYYADAPINLYAQWVAIPEYTVTYYSNGADSGSVPASETARSGERVTIAGNTGNLVREGYTFSGWNTASDGEGTDYAEGSTFTVYGSLSLYANWDVDGFVGEDDSYPVITDFSFRKSVINEAEKKEDIVFTITTRCENTLWYADASVFPPGNGAGTYRATFFRTSPSEDGESYVGDDHSGVFTLILPLNEYHPEGEWTIGYLNVISKSPGGQQKKTTVLRSELLEAGYGPLTFTH